MEQKILENKNLNDSSCSDTSIYKATGDDE